MQTLEDLDFNSYDVSFMNQLRSNQSLPKVKIISIENAPSFYEHDIERYRNKFQTSIAERQKVKQKIGGSSKDFDNVSNCNVRLKGAYQKPNSPLLRPPSRFSNTNFTNVDIDYSGNAKDVRLVLNIVD